MNQAILGADALDFGLWLGGATLAALALLAAAFTLLRKARLLEDTPTSLIRSAAQGYVELRGHARLLPGPEVISPLSDSRCAWWSYRVEKLERRGDKSEWRTVENETSAELFLIADTTGECIVDPEGADVVPSIKRSWRGPAPRPHRPPDGSWLSFGDYRYHERLVQVGDPLYVIGWFRTQGIEHEFDQRREVGELLAEWKKDQAALLARFDADRDGQIDAQEWEAVRRAAIEQVRAEQVERSLHPEMHVIGRPRDRRSFILSTITQDALTRRYRLWGMACLLLWLGIGAGCVHALQLRHLL